MNALLSVSPSLLSALLLNGALLAASAMCGRKVFELFTVLSFIGLLMAYLASSGMNALLVAVVAVMQLIATGPWAARLSARSRPAAVSDSVRRPR
ncbi:hypothetical protein [Stenotrophomonas sp.]|uniref:hypothetical protein n=1 Tax=Stenotrophomonas sp. TaxID=69392 RepID=UPI0028ABB26B|nr:hypothetical protein [Stenotrophomonas sp.]